MRLAEAERLGDQLPERLRQPERRAGAQDDRVGVQLVQDGLDDGCVLVAFAQEGDELVDPAPVAERQRRLQYLHGRQGHRSGGDGQRVRVHEALGHLGEVGGWVAGDDVGPAAEQLGEVGLVELYQVVDQRVELHRDIEPLCGWASMPVWTMWYGHPDLGVDRFATPRSRRRQ
ncbi:hypothetical protein [uncultured Jatrophihabitans sp.]|uniref:hypothetical protein n=1 Tax=uncultured Jatrophihabitans sp. TaxID=1610747 RepID=UPI0035CB80AF